MPVARAAREPPLQKARDETFLFVLMDNRKQIRLIFRQGIENIVDDSVSDEPLYVAMHPD
jgi:hypothetical protein